MKFKYVGPKRSEKVLAYDADFSSGSAEVKGEALLTKARANPEFEEVRPSRKKN